MLSNFIAHDFYFHIFIRAIELRAINCQLYICSCSTFQYIADFIHASIDGRFTIYSQYFIARLQSRFLSRRTIKHICDKNKIHCFIKCSPYAIVFPFSNIAVALNITLRNIIGIRIERIQHRIHTRPHELGGVNIIYIIGVEFLVEVSKNFNIFTDFKILTMICFTICCQTYHS